MPAGRPPIWDDPEAFDKAVDGYFEKEKDGATWTGLALHLGFSSRDSLNDYAKKPEYSDSVKKGLLRIESKYEKAMMKQPAGAIFALKNFGWTDKTEINQNTRHSGEIKHNVDYSKLSDEALRELANLDKPEESQD